MKKILSVFLLLTVLLSFCACGNNTGSGTQSTGTTVSAETTATVIPEEVTKSTEFDENNIVFSFGSLSDVHIDGGEDASSRYTHALLQLRAMAAQNDPDGLDAVVISGDIANSGKTSEYELSLQLFEEVFGSPEYNHTQLFTVTGNHDYITNMRIKDYYDIAGEGFYLNLQEDSNLSAGYQHFVCNGYHFLMVEPLSYGGNNGCHYSAESIQWLDSTLQSLTSENPEQYVFVSTHPMIYNTCYGSGSGIGTDQPLGNYWYTMELTSTLSKYNQVVTFGGHLHYPISDEKSIMSTAFTSLGCGSVRYMAIDAGGYMDMKSKTVMNDNQQVSSGLLVQMDANGNMKITRCAFLINDTYKDPWVLQYPDSEGSHLVKYSAENRISTNTNPWFDENSSISVELKDGASGTASAVLSFSAAKDDDLIHDYRISITSSDGLYHTDLHILADFYLYSDVSEMKDTYTVDLGSLPGDREYTAKVIAYDSWGAESNAITASFTVGTAAEADKEIPEAYTDFDFDGSVTDSSGKYELISDTALHSVETLVLCGQNISAPVLKTTAAGQCAVLRSLEYSSSTITGFFNGAYGFSFEVTYVNEDPSGAQGIFCGTQGGGVGIAEDNGTPYFFVYTENSSIKALSSKKASTTELNHVIASAIYNPATNTTTALLYLNGELVASGSAQGKIKVSSAAAAANAFSFGSDIDANGGGTDFKTTRCKIADAKVYTSAFNIYQAENEYSFICSQYK